MALITPKLLSRAWEDPIVRCVILDSKPGRIVRDQNDEPWEAELCLIKSTWGARSSLDLTGTDEPGQIKYYLVELPLHGTLRPKQQTAISAFWLRTARSFDTLEEAKEAYGD